MSDKVTKEQAKAILKWFTEIGIDGHTVYDSTGLRESFKKATGLDAPWDGTPARVIAKQMKDRGLGGWMHEGDPKRLLVSGYVLAELVNERWGSDAYYRPMGIGSRCSAALAAFAKATA